jgi:hypothetical protein
MTITADHTAEIIKFPFDVSRRALSRRPRASKNGTPEERASLSTGDVETVRQMVRPAPKSATAENSDIRYERREVWRRADAAVGYWTARLKFERAVGDAQRLGLSEGRSHAIVADGDDQLLVNKYRAALAKQLLTPAWDANSVKWKQAKLASERASSYYSLTVNPERIERAIADDLAFLAAHPPRRSNSEARARSREFNEAMRQRIRDLAASCDLPDDEIKSVLRLKHQEIGAFAVKHSVSLAWLLEGAGPIFKKYPTAPRPEMTGEEFAAVVATLPVVHQEAIRAAALELLERDQ